jgi:signal transduction histidine kinase
VLAGSAGGAVLAGSAGDVADTLRIEVTNMTDASGDDGPGAGRGLDGMRRRLEAIGGHLEVRRREQPAGISFTVTAYVPVRDRA